MPAAPYYELRGDKMTIRRLTRSRKNGTIAGVCAGLADYYGVDVVLVRLLFVILSIAGAIIGGVIVYVAAWVIMPEGDDQPTVSDRRVLRRSTTDKWMAGICGGMAEYFQVDAALVRLIWVIGSIFCGAIIGGILVYALAWIIIPRSPDTVISTPVQATTV
jgi:phage shock protein PspC (stress-responsive transcriptional regulator)